jgi:hypothetical protein
MRHCADTFPKRTRLSPLPPEGNHIASHAAIQIVALSLHHQGSRLQVYRVVAESTDLISLQVSQLKFNMFVRPALFMQMG